MLEWNYQIVFSITFTSQNWAFWVMKALVNLIQNSRLRNLWRKGLQFLLLLFLDLVLLKYLLLIKLLLFYSRFGADEGRRKGHRRSYMTSATDIWHWFSLWDKQPKCCFSPWSAVVSSALSPGYTWNHIDHTWHRWLNSPIDYYYYFLLPFSFYFGEKAGP